MTDAEKRAFAELVREAYLASADVDREVEKAMRLGREEPLEHERAVSLVEHVLRWLQEGGELPSEDARSPNASSPGGTTRATGRRVLARDARDAPGRENRF